MSKKYRVDEEDEELYRQQYTSMVVNKNRAEVERKGEFDRTKVDKQYKRDKYMEKRFEENGSGVMKDAYGNIVYQKKSDAKKNYPDGTDYAKHTASVDHIVSLSEVYSRCRYNPFLTTEDIKNIGNREKNYDILNMSSNQSKGDRKRSSEHAKEQGVSHEDLKEIRKKEAQAEIAIAGETIRLTAKNMGQVATTGMKKSVVTVAADNMMDSLVKMSEGEDATEVITQAAVSTVKGTVEAGKAAVAQTAIEGALQLAKDKIKNDDVKKALEKLGKLDEHGGAGTVYSIVMDSTYILKQSFENGELDMDAVKNVVKGEVKSKVRREVQKAVDAAVKETVKKAVETQIKKVAEKIGQKFGSKIGGVIGNVAGPVGSVIGSAIGYFAGWLAGALIGSAIDAMFEEDYAKLLNEIILENMSRYREKMEMKLDMLHEQHQAMVLSAFLIMREGIYTNNPEIVDEGIDALCVEYGFGKVCYTQDEFENYMLDESFTFEFGYVKKNQKGVKK